MQKSNPKKRIFAAQKQQRPGLEYKMSPLPEFENYHAGNNLLKDKKCIITGGDSGIGRAVAIAFAREGADVAIIHLKAEQRDADETIQFIKDKYQKQCLSVTADLAKEKNCHSAIQKIIKSFKHVDVLVNNAGVHYPESSIEKISTARLIETFSVNVFAMFWLTQAVLPYMKEGGSIINTSSVTAYRGSGGLIDYSATKGAIVSFTRSLSANLISRNIRVNGVAPGPVWTPLIPASFKADEVAKFGTDSPMKRPAQPAELAGAYIFLASVASSYISGQFIHVNGGEIVNG